MAGTQTQFSRTITEFPGGEKSFIEIPFEAGANTERIEVSYHFPFGSGGSVIDLGMAHEGRMRGWTGSERGHITIEADAATPGYDAGVLDGRWDVVLGVVKLGENCKVDVTVRVVTKQPRWFVGELHSHTEHSDGGVTVLDAIHRARASRLDFVALTDHNTISQNFIRPDDPSILVMPAMELTSYYGHANFLGLQKPVADWRCTSPADVADKMAEARANGATIVINHPFQRSAGGRWQSGFEVAFDAVEIWNGNWSPTNEEALAFWQEWLVAGHRTPATGGSDFHLKNRRRHGRPANRVFAEGRSVTDILAAVRAGRNVVSFSPEDTTAEPISSDAPMFGDTVAAGTSYAVRFDGLTIGDSIRTVTEDGVTEMLEAGEGSGVIEGRVPGRFVRFEVWHGAEPRLFTNPVYAE